MAPRYEFTHIGQRRYAVTATGLGHVGTVWRLPERRTRPWVAIDTTGRQLAGHHAYREDAARALTAIAAPARAA